MTILIKYILLILFYKILYQNENEISLDVTGIQVLVVLMIETALNDR